MWACKDYTREETWLEIVSSNVEPNVEKKQQRAKNQKMLSVSAQSTDRTISPAPVQLQSPVCMPCFKLFILLTNFVRSLNYLKRIKYVHFQFYEWQSS